MVTVAPAALASASCICIAASSLSAFSSTADFSGRIFGLHNTGCNLLVSAITIPDRK